MGLFGKKKEEAKKHANESLLTKIEFLPNDAARDQWVMYLYPNSEFNSGSILTINPGQAAIAVHAGKVAHIFAGDTGSVTLTTDNFPFLKNYERAVYGGKVSYDMKIYFINATAMNEIKWGTPSKIPVTSSDNIGGADLKFQFYLQANGSYYVRVRFYQYFLTQIGGSIAPGSWITWEDVKNKIKSTVNQRIGQAIRSYLAETKPSFSEATNFITDDNAAALQEKLKPEFEMFGLELIRFVINDVLIPEEDVQRYRELYAERQKDAAISDINIQNRLAKEQMEALKTAAGNQGTVGGLMGAGLGFGYGLGMMGQAQGMQPGQQAMNNINQQAQQQPAVKVRCPKCGALNDEHAKFCAECGTNLGPKGCPKCGAQLAPGAKFCPECGTKVE